MSITVFTATYDPEADALAIDLEGSGPGRSARTEHLDERRFVDYDATGRTIAIELLDVSGGVVFDGLPEAGPGPRRRRAARGRPGLVRPRLTRPRSSRMTRGSSRVTRKDAAQPGACSLR